MEDVRSTREWRRTDAEARRPPRYIRLPQVLEMTGLSTSTIYRWMTDGTFPKQIQLGSRSVVWNEREAIDWMKAQITNT